jgi:hypothetical protein
MIGPEVVQTGWESPRQKPAGTSVKRSFCQQKTASEPMVDTCEVGLTGFEPATSWSRTNKQILETTEKQASTAIHQSGCTAGCTSLQLIDQQSPSPLVAAFLALAQQLPLADRQVLGRILLSHNAVEAPTGSLEKDTGFK